MKRIVSTLLLVVTSALAQYETNQNEPIFQEHLGLYLSANLGLFYTTETNIFNVESSIYDSKSTEEFSGVLSLLDLRCGKSFNNIVSFYGVAGLGYGIGSYEEKDEEINIGQQDENYSFKENNNDIFRILFGGGGEFYPIQDKGNPLYGSFIGINAGFVVDIIQMTEHDHNQVYKDSSTVIAPVDIYCKFEFGKEWRLSRLWNYGFALNYTIGKLESKQGNLYNHTKKTIYSETVSHTSHTFGLAFRVSH